MGTNRYDHPSGDRYLTALSQGNSILVDFVRSFPGAPSAQVDSSWIDNWFSLRAQHFHQNPAEGPQHPVNPPDTLTEAIQTVEGLASSPFKLLDLRPHFFRGFRSLEAPVVLPDGLVVIDGPNSSGKTSLAEAFEWLFTGQLIRRSLHGQGAPRELENCICNQLRPEDESTWVEATLQTEGGQIIHLRRVLTADYGSTSTSKPSSTLFKDGNELAPQEEIDLLDALAFGVPPMLMQHTLRVFVHSSPAQRRDYFERLLRLDELTYLVEKAVVGDTRLPEFQSPTGGVALAKWDALKTACPDRASKGTMTRAERAPYQELGEVLSAATLAVGKEVLAGLVDTAATLDDAIVLVRARQRTERQQAFPILVNLHPQRAIDDQLLQLLAPDEMHKKLAALGEALSSLEAVQRAAERISEAHIAVSFALDALEKAGAISQTDEPQTCPLCGFEPITTLTPGRINTIRSWGPTREAIAKQRSVVSVRASAVRQLATSIREAHLALIPPDPEEYQWHAALQIAPADVVTPANELRQRATAARAALKALDTACRHVEDGIPSHQPESANYVSITSAVEIIAREAPSLISQATEYAKAFTTLDNAVGALSREDPTYGLRETWLAIASDQGNLLTDLSWEQSKKRAQAELEAIRDGLILARQTILNARRSQFSDGMTEVWQELREDKYSAFSRLYVPDPRGRGFPIEIEVKAVLDDSVRQVEVDALRVFSESQVHALGIAAFLTRARLLGHRCLVLDDPVQSMDEEHFLTFASNLLPYLLGQGIQVIILTHNDLFSRDVSHVFANADKYTTLRIRHSRRHGCQIEEGNRRAVERLKKAQALADEGKLEEAWRLVRVAVERIYLCTMIKHGPSDFDPRSWSNQTAEHMWTQGAGAIILAIAPDMAPRLKDILEMAVAGAHDKPPRGLADLTGAARDLRRLVETLAIGAA